MFLFGFWRRCPTRVEVPRRIAWYWLRRIGWLGKRWFGVIAFGLCLKKAVQSETIVFFVITVFVRLRAEFTSSGEPSEERELLAAIQASHTPCSSASAHKHLRPKAL